MLRTINQILLAACLAAIFAILVASLPTYPNDNTFNHQICQYNSTTHHEDCASYSLASFLLIKIGQSLNDYGVAVTALATVTVGLFTWQLKRSTDRLWTTAERQADLTRDAMIAGERAFVFATGFSPYWDSPADPLNPIYNWRFRPNWQNSGETPTKNMTMHTECVALDSPLPLDFDFNYATREIGKALIPPKITTQGGMAPRMPRPAITPGDIIDACEGRKFIYLWGWARYWDVFANTPRHITRFCWLIMPIGNPKMFYPNQLPTDVDSLKFNFVYHFVGNCADDECGEDA
jgi:hypothetical protein